MKKLLIAIAAVMVSVATYAQSAVVFNNRVGTDPDAPVKRPDGTGAGAGYTAELVFVGAGGALTPLTPTTTFRTSSAAAAFYVNSVDVVIPNLAPGPVTLRMRVYNGTSYDSPSSTTKGQSANFTVTTLDPTLPGVNLSGLTGFTLATTVIPEPATLALGALGLGALLIRRRK